MWVSKVRSLMYLINLSNCMLYYGFRRTWKKRLKNNVNINIKVLNCLGFKVTGVVLV